MFGGGGGTNLSFLSRVHSERERQRQRETRHDSNDIMIIYEAGVKRSGGEIRKWVAFDAHSPNTYARSLRMRGVLAHVLAAPPH